MSGGGAEREGNTKSEAAPGSELSVRQRAYDAELDLNRPQDHGLNQSRMLNRLSHPGTPIIHFFKVYLLILRERERGLERQTERENTKQAPCCQ